MSFTMKTLTEGIRQRHMGATHQRLTEKWNRTGLLRGLQGYNRENMSVLLENQAAQLLRETNTLGNGAGATSGNINGFQNVAFPIVRRVFGGLVANELVSIQPMSLPSGLLFYLDYTYGSDQGAGGDLNSGGDIGAGESSVYNKGTSIYNNPTGKKIQSGSLGTGGQYDLLGSGYSRRHDMKNVKAEQDGAIPTEGIGYIELSSAGVISAVADAGTLTGHSSLTGEVGRLLDFDAQVAQYLADNTSSKLQFAVLPVAAIEDGGTVNTTTSASLSSGLGADLTLINDIAVVHPDLTSTGHDFASQTVITGADVFTAQPAALQGGTNVFSLRRFTQRINAPVAGQKIVPNPLGGTYILFPMIQTGTTALDNFDGGGYECVGITFPVASSFSADSTDGSALTIPSFESTMKVSDLGNNPVIPEIDIKIESLAVTAVSRKLKAKWSPELAQDLNAYHSLDAEVELTQILSEQIALELDREVLNDLLTQANGANLYWSRSPGKFVNKLTGVEIARTDTLRPGPQFTGTVRDWYETLVETIIDAANIIHRKTLRGSANFIVIGPDVATIFESSVMYKPSYSIDGQGQVSAISIGAEKIGSLSNRFTVYKDPYFPRNKVLIGYKGGSYLETGYVYAPYVPLIVTPTIFAPEDFTPRKGVMTRYGKKMVRSDFYGTVTCMDMNII
jgi:hypothetical protein